MTVFSYSEDILDLTSEENVCFKGDFWRVIRVTMPTEKKAVYSPPHFADTLEILLTKNIEGEIKINYKTETFATESAHLIPPKTVHSMKYFKGGDFILCLQIDLNKLHHYVNLDNVLSEDAFSLHHCFCTCKDFDRLYTLVTALSHENTFAQNLAIILNLFSCFSPPDNEDKQINNFDIQKVISYIGANFNQQITLSSVAAHFGYHKNYFCCYFKKNTGTTFTKYLNNIRIANACYFLASNNSVNATCGLCGFSDPAYFIKIFRQIVGSSPAQYAKSINKNSKPTHNTPSRKRRNVQRD